MNKLNRTVLASLALCALAFAQSASAQDQVKSDSTIKSVPQSAVVKPVGTTVSPNKVVGGAPSANGKTKMCLSPIGQMVPCK